MKHRARIVALAARILAVPCLLLAACASLQDSTASAERPNLTRVSLFAHPWTWTDERGASVKFARWRGEPLVVSAIYTTCRAQCPRTIAKLKQLDAAFRKEGHVPQFLVVTLDPTTDTPDALRQFKESEHLPESWRFLAGTVEQTGEFADALDIHVLAADSHRFHDGRIVIFDAQGMPARSLSGRNLDDDAPAL
jgi:protein SCO1/2